ncbi:MAG TPA: addiction module toxin RelE [Serratia liquefaciens]|nr:addiction module toxin RelE [Serratia liquefaciens]
MRPDSLYPIVFRQWLGGKQVNPRELTQVSDWGAPVQPTTPRFER